MKNELFERELQNTSINDVSLADYVKENYLPISVLDKIRDEIESQRKEVSNKNPENNELQAFYYGLNDGLKDARDIIDKYRGDKA